MVQKPVYLTPDGLKKLEEEMAHLLNERRPYVIERIQRAKEMGGTENNAEYEDVKNEQAFVEGRIRELDLMLKNAKVIHEGATTTIRLGSRVKVEAPDGGHEEYTIVGSAEADPHHGRISNESPVGRALLGKRVGDVVEVTAPAGKRRLKIIEVA
ncbi:MAG: transcription elongation factor GreA [Dehalococcoidia bacterium]|nr:transcription elongation factor GreA [Dehalococcoidia bacterium]